MIYAIQNHYLKVLIQDRGAELHSIKKVNDPVEYLWQGNPVFWDRQAPLLFPIIGRLKKGYYTHSGVTYHMGIHGFARDMPFQTVQEGPHSIAFILESSPDTLDSYPFRFHLMVSYSLEGNTIRKRHYVKNTGMDEMYFEIGGHEGYNLALFEGEGMEDYFIQFHERERLETYTTDQDIMITRIKKPIPVDTQNRLFLSCEVFKNDALIIDGFQKRRVSLRNLKNDRSVTVAFDDFNYLGIWTRYARSNYVCIEPWSSLPDCNYLGQEISKKVGVIQLDSGESRDLGYSITIE